jgi:S-DNA-T family DNA segregation ATPase FtsK/SpoIIIE
LPVALRTTEASHADMILGDGALDRGAACHRIPDSLPGVGYVYVEGTSEPVRVRFTYLTDPDIRTLATSYAPGTEQPTAETAPVPVPETGWVPA